MFVLSVVVPIGPNFQNFGQMFLWISEAVSEGIQVVIVRDSLDEQSKRAFDKILEQIPEEKMIIVKDVAVRSPGEARNSGINESTGEWIAFWDCDDFPNPTIVLGELEKASSETQVVIGQCKINGKERTTKNLLDVAYNPGNWRFVYRRDFVGMNRFTKEIWGEDQLFILETGALGSKITISRMSFYDYQVGGSMQLTSKRENSIALEKVLSRAISAVSREKMSKTESITSCIMILRMSLTLVKRSTKARKIRAIYLFGFNNFRLITNYKKFYFIAWFHLFRRTIGQ